MKKILFALSVLILLASCSKEEKIPETYQDLFILTDAYTIWLCESSSHSYGLEVEGKRTHDGVFSVMVVGRMVVVKINDESKADIDTTLRYLRQKYIGTYGINDVYKNEAGGITIDCRR